MEALCTTVFCAVCVVPFLSFLSSAFVQGIKMEPSAVIGLHQVQRPSPHSFVVLLSHIALVMPIFAAWHRTLRVEALCILLSSSISFGYHLCDENFFCPLRLGISQWHALDVWGTFFLTCFVFGVSVLNLQRTRIKLAVRLVYFAAVSGAVWYDRASMLLFGGLLGSVALLIFMRYVGINIVARFIQAAAPPDPVKTVRLQRTASLRHLVNGICCFCASLLCFLLANTPVVGSTRYDPAVHGPMKPMDLPDTSVYWLFHSAWHVGSATSVYFVLVFIASEYTVRCHLLLFRPLLEELFHCSLRFQSY